LAHTAAIDDGDDALPTTLEFARQNSIAEIQMSSEVQPLLHALAVVYKDGSAAAGIVMDEPAFATVLGSIRGFEFTVATVLARAMTVRSNPAS